MLPGTLVCVPLGTRYLAFLALLFYVFLSQPVHYPFERNSVVKDTFGGKLFFFVCRCQGIPTCLRDDYLVPCSAHGTAMCEGFARL